MKLGNENTANETVTVGQIFSLVCEGKRVIAVLTCMCVLIAILVSVISKPIYRSYYVVMPVPPVNDPLRQSSSMSLDVLGRQGKSPDWEMYLSELNSHTLSQQLAGNTDILQRINPDLWDAQHRQWLRYMPSDKLSFGGKIKRMLGLSKSIDPPDSFFLNKYINDNLGIVPVPNSTQITISFDSTDPNIPLYMLKIIHQNANDLVRKERNERASIQKSNLLDELKNTTDNDSRTTLLSVLSKVETNYLTSSIRGQFAAIYVDGPITLPKPVYPNPILFLKLAVVAGIVLGMILVVFFPINDERMFAFWCRFRKRLLWRH